jgi:23S rRNA (pseudouridine1915-N3)-methyltransferase
MAVKVLCIGKTSESYLNEGMEIYKQRLKKYGGISFIELPDVKKKHFSNPEELKVQEAVAFMKEIRNTDFVVGLDEKGIQYGSRAFAKKWNDLLAGNSNLTFVIGGAYGFNDELRERFNLLISLSEMTFSHQLVRLLFLEQAYRANTILHGEPYHND